VMKDFKPLSQDERAAIDKVVAIINEIDTVPCTSCGYCTGECPQKINIPGIIKAYNRYKLFESVDRASSRYRDAVRDRSKASDCTECLACVERCPQKIAITDILKESKELFEK